MNSKTTEVERSAVGVPKKGGWIFAATIFVSAFLLFQVQPLISKAILPWFGGSPAVWTTCMLFFQLLLLAGYGYAHLITRHASPRFALWVHLGLLGVALFFLPIIPTDKWKPDPAGTPVAQILLLLSVSVGVPYFLLSTTGPLVQAWYHRWSGGSSPYRLYALSNIGSLGALLTYPFLFEPALGTSAQGWTWSGAFCVFVLACATTAWVTRRPVSVSEQDEDSEDLTEDSDTESQTRVGLFTSVMWLLLPALASVMLLSVTSHISQDIAVFPFLWILPLSLYLLSFIICFDRPNWYRPVLKSLALFVFVAGIAVMAKEGAVNDWLINFKDQRDLPQWLTEWLVIPSVLDYLWLEVGFYAGALFCLCMICHGEVVRRKPHASRLTGFYLMIAAGGALGGLLSAVVFPRVFTSHMETPAGWVLAVFLAVLIVGFEAVRQGSWWIRWPQRFVAVGLLAALWILVPGIWPKESNSVIDARRNFFGVLRVVEWYPDDPDHHYSLYNGRILHGVQLLESDRRYEPTTYFSGNSGVGVAITMLPIQGEMRVGTIGLGAGTIAAYGRNKDHYTFYEINPAVVELNKKWFTFISDLEARGGTVDIELGDARLTLERQKDQDFHVLAIDAFTGDAIPSHLLTKEAFDVYMRHVRQDGVIAVHISNRHLDLVPVVVAAAEEYKMRLIHVDSEDEGGAADAGSEWLLMTRNADFCDVVSVISAGIELVVADEKKMLWTDDYSSLWGILRELPFRGLRDFFSGQDDEE